MATPKKTPSGSNRKRSTPRRRASTPRQQTSSVQTNSFIKGMNKDIAPSLENNQSWWHARNLVNNDQDGDTGVVGNEPANIACGVIPYTVIGAIHRYGDEWVIYSTNDTSSEIGRFDDSECKYTTIVNDPCLNFNRKNLITGAAKENFDCTWQVYWDDGLNPSRTLNIDEVPYKQYISSPPGDPCVVYSDIEPKQLDCEKIRLAPLLDTPCVKLSKATDGGMLLNGAYQAFVAYVENEYRVTDYIGVSNIQTLFDHDGSMGSLDIKVSNLDKDYEYYELVLLRRNQGQTSAKRIGFYSTEQQDINIDYIDESLVAIDISQIPLMSPAYEKSEAMYVVNDWLLRQGPTEQFDFNYQPIANEIKTSWVVNQLDSTYYHLDGNKYGFMRDEQYAFFIRWIYNTGERSSSYHIPGRAPANYTLPNGSTVLEDSIIFGANVLDAAGDPVFKVYNTANIQQQNLSEPQEDASLVIARGEMGYWESTERYPSNRPDIWGDLCGKPIRHHKMPCEDIGGTNSPLNISTTDGDLINIVGVEFSNIGRPTNNDGSYIENVVGYEILRGSRQGARSILAKGMFKNMRKYEIPDQENLLGTSTQGLYPNYPFNSLQDDVFFHNGNRRNDHATSGCDNSFTSSINKYTPLKGHTDDVFTFSSPDLMFTKPFLNAYETKIYGEISGQATGHFIDSEGHPQHKLLRPTAASIASIIGVGYALNAVQGTPNKTNLPAQGFNPAYAPWALVGVSSGGTVTAGLAPGALGGPSSLAGFNVLQGLLLDELLDNAADFTDLFLGGAGSLAVMEGLNTAELLKTLVPGTMGGGQQYGVVMDKPEGSLPSVMRALISISMAQKNISIGAQEIIDLFYNLVSKENFALKYNAVGFYNRFNRINLNDNFRVKNSDSNYLGSSFQTFDGTKYKVNNLFRPNTVVVSTEKPISSDYSITDNSRFALGGYVNSNGSIVDYGNQYLKNYEQPFKTNISALYGSLKFNMDNQYGQLAGIKQVQMRGCVELLDPTKAEAFKYTSKPIFSGDVFINRYTEKCIMPIFTDFLKGQPDEFTYDYLLRVNVPYPRFWMDTSKYDVSALAREISTLGFSPGSFADAFPTDKYYLDRGEDNCQSASLIGSLFGGGNDLNPAFAMKYAYMYTHVNGIQEFFVESEINLANRDWEDLPSKRFYDIYEYNDVAQLFHADHIKDDNFYKYDDSLSVSKFPTQMSSFGAVQSLDYDPLVAAQCFTSYPKRLIYSLQAKEESKKDFWRVFLNLNYKDFKNKVSGIKPINKSGAFIFFPYLSPQMFQGLDTLKTQLDTKLTIGDGGLFSQPFQNVVNSHVSNEYGSCESLRSIMSTPVGLFYISQAQGKIFHYGGKGLDPISNRGMKWWFNKYLPSALIKQFPSLEDTVIADNPVVGVGCQTIYDTNNDTVYFMKKDFRVKKDYIKDATEVDGVIYLNINSAQVPVVIGDPIYFDDCSWTVSYDPKSKAWISFHDWHPELSLPSINHFLTTKTETVTAAQCPPDYSFNPSTGLCEQGQNTTSLATVDIDDIAATVTGGTSACLLDIVIAVDFSTSTMTYNAYTNASQPLPQGLQNAQQQWLQSFITDPAIQAAQAAGTLQIGFTAWASNSREWNTVNGSVAAASTFSMSNTYTAAQVDTWMRNMLVNRNVGGGTGGSTSVVNAFADAQVLLDDKTGSQLGDRSADANFSQIIILVTDTQGTAGNQTQYQSSTLGGGAAANQFVYGLYAGQNSPSPLNQLNFNSITSTGGPATISATIQDPYQYGIQATITPTYPITNWALIANTLVGQICGTPFACSCPAGYTLVYQNPTTSAYDQSTGTCDDITPPICRKVTCECPTTAFGTVTQTGTCPDTAPLLYQIGDPNFVQPDPKTCNSFGLLTQLPNYNVGSLWRHNARCDLFANFYNKDYPWEIDIISNTGQAVNTVRSFEYQLENYVYKGTLGDLCGEDKWEDINWNFDHAIVYNNDQVSGMLNLNLQPIENPWSELNYPTINLNDIDILASKVEHKFRFNQFWDITNDRGEFPDAAGIYTEQSIFNTYCNGYVRALNSTNLNYNKPATQRKKFRHYSNHVILRKNVSTDRKMLLRLNNTKLQLSMR